MLDLLKQVEIANHYLSFLKTVLRHQTKCPVTNNPILYSKPVWIPCREKEETSESLHSTNCAAYDRAAIVLGCARLERAPLVKES